MHDRVASPRARQRAGWTRRWHCMGNRRRRAVRRRSHAASTLCTQISGNDEEETCQNRTAEDQKALHGSPGCPANGPPTSLPNDSLHTKMRRVRPRFQVSLPAFLLLDAPLLIPPPSASPIRSPCAITIPAVERAVKQPPASLPSQPVSVEFSPTAGSQASVAGSPPVEDACRYCPVCSQRLESRRCKLICPVCGYYMSCADYY